MSLHYSLCYDQNLSLMAKTTKTATFTGAAKDLGAFGQGANAVISVTAAGGTTPTLDVEIQASDDAQFGSCETFPHRQITDEGLYLVGVHGNYRYWRIKGTIGGTQPTFDIEAYITP